MADIFYAKDILKNINRPGGYHTSEGAMRKIHGLYVTGVWRPPHYIERHLFITDIGLNNKPAEVAAYTTDTKYQHPGDYMNAIIEFTSASKLTFDRFSNDTKYQRPGDYMDAIIEFTAGDDLTFTKFITITSYVRPGDYMDAIIEFTCLNEATTSPYYVRQPEVLPPGKPALQIKSISGTPATVEIQNG